MRRSKEMIKGPYSDIEKCQALELAMGMIADYPVFCLESVCSLFILHDIYEELLVKNDKQAPEIEDIFRNFKKQKGKFDGIIMREEIK